MAATKILISGLANSGKTTLLKGLGTNCLIVARDGKKYPFKQPHVNSSDFKNINEFLNELESKIDKFEEKNGHLPEVIAFDSVSRIFTDIMNNCNEQYKGFDIWKEIDKQINTFCKYINNLVESDINVVLVAHVMWNEDAKKYVEVSKGSFGKIGGFVSTVDYAIYIDLAGKTRTIYHKQHNMARSMLPDTPVAEPVDNFNLKDYLNKILEANKSVEDEWGL